MYPVFCKHRKRHAKAKQSNCATRCPNWAVWLQYKAGFTLATCATTHDSCLKKCCTCRICNCRNSYVCHVVPCKNKRRYSAAEGWSARCAGVRYIRCRPQLLWPPSCASLQGSHCCSAPRQTTEATYHACQCASSTVNFPTPTIAALSIAPPHANVHQLIRPYQLPRSCRARQHEPPSARTAEHRVPGLTVFSCVAREVVHWFPVLNLFLVHISLKQLKGIAWTADMLLPHPA